LDDEGHRATIGDRDLNLTAVEFGLFRVLVGHPGRIYTREQLMDAMYRDERVASLRFRVLPGIGIHARRAERVLAQTRTAEALDEHWGEVGLARPVDDQVGERAAN